MSVYLKHGTTSVLLNSSKVATDAVCCCGCPPCCPDTFGHHNYFSDPNLPGQQFNTLTISVFQTQTASCTCGDGCCEFGPFCFIDTTVTTLSPAVGHYDDMCVFGSTDGVQNESGTRGDCSDVDCVHSVVDITNPLPFSVLPNAYCPGSSGSGVAVGTVVTYSVDTPILDGCANVIGNEHCEVEFAYSDCCSVP